MGVVWGIPEVGGATVGVVEGVELAMEEGRLAKSVPMVMGEGADGADFE